MQCHATFSSVSRQQNDSSIWPGKFIMFSSFSECIHDSPSLYHLYSITFKLTWTSPYPLPLCQGGRIDQGWGRLRLLNLRIAMVDAEQTYQVYHASSPLMWIRIMSCWIQSCWIYKHLEDKPDRRVLEISVSGLNSSPHGRHGTAHQTNVAHIASETLWHRECLGLKELLIPDQAVRDEFREMLQVVGWEWLKHLRTDSGGKWWFIGRQSASSSQLFNFGIKEHLNIKRSCIQELSFIYYLLYHNISIDQHRSTYSYLDSLSSYGNHASGYDADCFPVGSNLKALTHATRSRLASSAARCCSLDCIGSI